MSYKNKNKVPIWLGARKTVKKAKGVTFLVTPFALRG